MKNKDNSLVCFVHIEKAAGTTLHHIFINNIPTYVTLKPWYYWSNQPGNDLNTDEAKFLLSKIPKLKAFGGHTVRSYHDYESALGRKIQYFTFLRQPVSRYISHFRYQRDIMNKDWTIETFLAEKRFDNYMTRRISPSGDVNEAMDVLKNKYAFTGLMEDFDRSLLLMKDNLDLIDFDVAYEIQNTNVKSDKKKDERMNDATMAAILESNKDDILLYDFVKNELYPSYIAQYSGNLDNELAELLVRNETFSFSFKNKYFAKIFQLGYYNPLERIGKFLYHRS